MHAPFIADLNTLNAATRHSLGYGFDHFGPTCIDHVGLSVDPQMAAIGLKRIVIGTNYPIARTEEAHLDRLATGGSVTAAAGAAAAAILPIIAKKLVGWVGSKVRDYAVNKATNYAANKASDVAKNIASAAISRLAKKVAGGGVADVYWDAVGRAAGMYVLALVVWLCKRLTHLHRRCWCG